MWLYSQTLPSARPIKIQIYFFFHIAIAAVLETRRLYGREEINLKLVTQSLVLVLSLLMPESIKHKLTETGLVKMSHVLFCLDWSLWSLN